MRKLLLILPVALLPVALLATGCSALFKPHDNSSMGNTTFSNMSWGTNTTTPAPAPPPSGGDLTADQGGNAAAPAGGKPGAGAGDTGGDQGQTQDQGDTGSTDQGSGDQGSGDQGAPAK